MHKLFRRFKKRCPPLPVINLDALRSYESDKEKSLKEKRRQARYCRPKETDQQGDICLARFFVNHRMLSEIGERKVLHSLNSGIHGKPGSAKHEYISAWLKDMEYERTLDYTDETNDLARAANKAADDANELARRALLTARISAATAVIALIAAMMTQTML